MYWRSAISFFFPTLEAIRRVPRAIRQFRWYNDIGRPQMWFVRRLWEFDAFLFCCAISQEMCLSYRKEYWLIFLLRGLAESFVTTWIVNEMFDVPCDFLDREHYQLPRCMLKWLFVASLAQFRHSPLAGVIFLVLALWTGVILLETASDQLRSHLHKNDPRPKIESATTYWSLVSLLQSSNNGYLSGQFCPIKLCDPNRLDDPFWPDQVSTVFVVELRRRNMLWRQLIIWQVSLLNGGKNKILVFNVVDQWTNYCHIECFESKGVIFIRDGWLLGDEFLLVFDTLHGKSATYRLPVRDYHQMVIAQCKRRIFDSDGSVQGWQVRLVILSFTHCECHVQQIGRRHCLMKIDLDLRQKAALITEEGVVFGSCSNWWSLRLRHIRNSNGSFGIYLERPSEQDGPSVLYDPMDDRFIYFPNFDALLRSDGPFALYNYTPSPIGSLAVGDEYGDLCPAVLTSQECVECFEDGQVFRTEFKVSSVKYVTAKTIFRGRPNLRNEMSAKEFRQATGIDEMQGHFDK